MLADGYDSRGNANRGRVAGHVLQHDGVGADTGMVPNLHAAKNLGAGPDAHVCSDHWRAGVGSSSANRHLLKDQTIGAND